METEFGGDNGVYRYPIRTETQKVFSRHSNVLKGTERESLAVKAAIFKL